MVAETARPISQSVTKRLWRGMNKRRSINPCCVLCFFFTDTCNYRKEGFISWSEDLITVLL